MMLQQRAFFLAAFALLRADAFQPTSHQSISLPCSGIGLAPAHRNRYPQASKIGPPHLDTTSSPSALEASPVATVAAVAVAPPSLKAVALACLIPTLLGYYKSEYGVSYAYGTAVATVAYLTLRALPVSSVLPVPTAIAACHASAVFFYGIRLNLFLMYREIFVPRFAKMRERIEERAIKRGSRLARSPFILVRLVETSVALTYYYRLLIQTFSRRSSCIGTLPTMRPVVPTFISTLMDTRFDHRKNTAMRRRRRASMCIRQEIFYFHY